MNLKKLFITLSAFALFFTLSCGNTDHINIFHVNFASNGAAKDFTTQVGFSNLLSIGYSISYSLVLADTSHNVVSIYVPVNPQVNVPYVRGSSNFSFVFTDSNSVIYRSSRGSSTFSLTITQWPGIGGYAKGTFSGTLYDDTETAFVTIQSGTFEGFIHN